MQIRIEASNLPGRSCGPGPDGPTENIHVAVQRKDRPGELLGLCPGDAPSAVWTLDVRTLPTPEGDVAFAGPYIQNRLGGRFVYLSWVTVDDSGACRMFRRAKIMLDGIPADVAKAAVESGLLVGRLGLTDAKGNPTCASVRPPLIEWLAGVPAP